MSPKDLCTRGMIDKLIECGVEVFKIEGRARSPEYVYIVTKTYKNAIDAVTRKSYTKENIRKWLGDLSKVFNRGFWENGYYGAKKQVSGLAVTALKLLKKKLRSERLFTFMAKA